MPKGVFVGETFVPPREKRSEVKGAFDKGYDPERYMYGGEPAGDRQAVDGLSFADLRDDMNRRRRKTARRMRDEPCY